MALKRFIALLFTLLGLIQPSYQQAWKNNNIVWGQAQQENYLPPLSNQPSGENLGLGSLIGYNFQQQQQQQQQLQQHQQQHQQQQQQQQHQQQQQQQQQLQQHQQQYHQQQQQQQSNEQNEGKKFLIHNAPSFFYPNPSPVEIPAQAPKPINFAPSTGPQPAAAASAPSPQPVLVDKAQPSQSGPYDIKHETITSNGQKLVENLLGGVPYNCAEKPTGHFRDAHFCDVFHACVFGQQQKSYACPYVGEAQYFDDVTRKCEFVRSNPEACASNAFFH